MIVVADTSAISNLMAIGREGILRDLFGQVLIPPAVERELLDWHRDLPAFVVVEQPGDLDAVSRLSLTLDPGESEAIALAVQVRADLLLIDERKGRSFLCWRARTARRTIIGRTELAIAAEVS